MSQAKLQSPEFPEDAEVDPRVEDELEKMNVVALQLNEMETLLHQARQKFRNQLNETAARLECIQASTGNSCVEKARPYYEAKRQCKLLQAETQSAALRYDRSCEMLATAKDMVRTAESSCPPTDRGGQVDETWAMMLNQATEKVALAEKERQISAQQHASLTSRFIRCQERVRDLEQSLKSVIRKSRPYFEVNARCQQALVEQKQHVEVYEEKVRICKRLYDEALRTLETISEEIHERRREEKAAAEMARGLGERGEGVGAEDPPEPPLELEGARSAALAEESAGVESAPRAKPRHSKCLRSSVVTPIMALLQDTMREHAKENARLEHQRQHAASPTHSASSSLDDDTLADFVPMPADLASGSSRSNSPAVVETGGAESDAQRTLVLAPDLKRFLRSLEQEERR